MTRDSQFANLLTDWLEDQPDRAPSRLLETVLTDLQSTPQSARWKRVLRRFPMFNSNSTVSAPRSSGLRRLSMAVATGAASVAITALILLGALRTASWLRESPVEVRTSDPASREPLPIVRDGERRLDRARSLRDAGRLREALRELDVVELGDPLRPEADQLRSEIQRVLLSAAKGGIVTGERPR